MGRPNLVQVLPAPRDKSAAPSLLLVNSIHYRLLNLQLLLMKFIEEDYYRLTALREDFLRADLRHALDAWKLTPHLEFYRLERDS